MPIVWVSFKLLTVTTILYNYFFSNESDTSEVKGGHFSFDFFLLFFLGFLSRPFTNHRTAREGGGNFFNSLLPLPPALQTLRH